MKLGVCVLGCLCALLSCGSALEQDWQEFHAAEKKQLVRTATNVLARIETQATAQKVWPDLAAAMIRRFQCEYSLAEENALDAEQKTGLIAQHAACVERAPVEVRPMLRLALAHGYLTLNDVCRTRRDGRTQLANATNQPPWSAERIVPTLNALFDAIAADKEVLAAQKIDDWQRLLSAGDAFARRCRPTLWDFAVHDAVAFSGRVNDTDQVLRKKVLAWLEDLSVQHPVATEPDAHVSVLYRKLQLSPDDLRQFAERWYGVSAVSADAAYAAAVTLAESGKGETCVEAHTLAARFQAKWPTSTGGRNCLRLIKELERPGFHVQIENQLLAQGEQIRVEACNLDRLHFRLVPVTFRQVLDPRLSYRGKNGTFLEKILNEKPVAEWSETIKNHHDYRYHVQDLAIPKDIPLGYYVLFVATNARFGADQLPCHYLPVSRTDLHLMHQCVDGQVKGFVHDAETGRPRAGVRVEYWVPSKRSDGPVATTRSAADGAWSIPVPKEGALGLVRACGAVEGGEQGTLESCLLREDDSWRTYAPSPMRVQLMTDRIFYRPGQTVKFKGYAYWVDAKARDCHVLAHRRVFVEFRDVNGKSVGTLALIANAFGTFSGEFVAPRDRLTGAYQLVPWLLDSNGKRMMQESVSVNVEEYKRPKFTVAFDKLEEPRLDAEMHVRGRAMTFTGLPVPGAKVRWSLRRTTRHSAWWCRWHDESYAAGRDDLTGETVTDEQGAFVCTFVPTAPKGATGEGEERYEFLCTAQVTDAAGETHEEDLGFVVGTVPWRLFLSVPSDQWVTPSTGVDWVLELRTHEGCPVPGVTAEVKAYALQQPKRPVRERADRHGEVDRAELQQLDWEADPVLWKNGRQVASRTVKTSAVGEAQGTFTLPAGAYRLVCTVQAPNGPVVRAMEFVRVIDPAAKAYSVREPVFRCFEKNEVKVGETARFFFGTGYESGYCRLRILQSGKVLVDKVREGTNWFFEFPVTEQHRGGLDFETTFVRENRLYRERRALFVPWDNLELKISREHLTSKLQPGTRETWRFRVSGANTNDVRRGVEALAFMYDKSLDQMRSYYPRLDFEHPLDFASFSRDTDWQRANADCSTLPWRGVWPVVPAEMSVAWPHWRVRLSRMAVFDTDVSYCRAGVLRKCTLVRTCYGTPPSAAALAMEAEEEDCEVESAIGTIPFGGGRSDSGSEDARFRLPPVVPRKNLTETAFFLPSLVSDENGIVEFSFTVPQALAGWKFYLFAHDPNLSCGSFQEDEIVTVKPLMVEPNGPRFAREGDSFLFPVKVTNTDAAPQRGTVSLTCLDVESGTCVIAPKDLAFDLKPGETKTFAFPITIPDGCGYLRTVAKAAGAIFTDGEEGLLPILSRRVLVQESLPMQIRAAGTRTFTFESLKAHAASPTLRHVGLTAQVVSDPTWFALLALPYLMEYPHECNEQIFSRYYAHALAEQIAQTGSTFRQTFETWERENARAMKSPLERDDDLKQVMLDATPWVRAAADESRAKWRLGELFGSARLEAEQARALQQLRESLGPQGLWPWFPGGPESMCVTLHILTGFARLERLGVRDGLPRSLRDQARQALDRKLEASVAQRLKMQKSDFCLSRGDLRWLYLQSFDKSWDKKSADLFLAHLEKEWTTFDIGGQALAALVLGRRGNGPLAKTIVRSLKERAVRSDEKGLYWKRDAFFDGSLFGAPVSDQVLAMEAFLEVEPEDVTAYEEARLWLLEQKRTQNWSSTVSTADAVYAILLGRNKSAPAPTGPVTMTLGGVEVPRTQVEAGTGFYEARYGAQQVKGAMGDVTLSSQENALGWASVTWTYLEDAAKVKAFEPKDLRLTKTYYKKMRVNGQLKLVALGEGVMLQPGDELVTRLAIDSNRILEYVHLKDEHPASAEPVDVVSSYRWQDGLGYYQSTRDMATHYYFERLPRGNFILETSFRVRQKGTFTSGLATLECMYAPEFGAHSASTTLEESGNRWFTRGQTPKLAR